MQTSWTEALTRETDHLLANQPGKVFRVMSKEFEATLIRCALAASGGRRVDAARLLGIGRSTITRKIHALGLDGADARRRRPQKLLFCRSSSEEQLDR